MNTQSTPESFRQRQVRSDLLGLIRRAARQSGASWPDDWHRIIGGQQGVLLSSDLGPVHEGLLLAAARPEADFDIFMAATAILLTDALARGAGADDLWWHYDAFVAQYRTAEPAARAALFQGFSLLSMLRKTPLVPAPDRAELLRLPLEEVMLPLVNIACAMTADEKQAVSQADGGRQALQHLEALELCLAGDCILSRHGTIFPSKVVQITSESPVAVGHLPCTALVLLDALEHQDRNIRAAWRWAHLSDDYLRHPMRFRKPFLAAFRFLFESNPDQWQPQLPEKTAPPLPY